MQLDDTRRAHLHEMAERAAARCGAPMLVYGIVLDGRLVASGGVDHVRAEATQTAPPLGVTTPMRIASMTKSFTAAAILALRDRGALALDDPVSAHVPELASLRPTTSDAPPVSIRHLLTMASGLPTDDPWADRLLDADRLAMDALFTTGAHFAHPVATRYQYSNYGYAMLGRVIEVAAGQPPQRFVESAFLNPLRMHATGWDPPGPQVGAPPGYRLDRGVPSPEPLLADGGFAPMGGLWSTVEDLGRWIGFFCDAFPARDDPDDGPLRRSSRREQQQVHRAFPPTVSRPAADGAVRVSAGGYGMGLVALEDLRYGHHVYHSGGLPGYGSNMRWLPERGVGVVALANVTYAPMAALTMGMLEYLGGEGLLPPTRAPARAGAIRDAVQAARALVTGGWDGPASRLLAPNVDADQRLAERAAEAARLMRALGTHELADVELESDAAATFALVGANGTRLVVDLELNGEVPARIHHLDFELSPGPDAPGAAGVVEGSEP